ncbi:Gfo/Idh/MocA family protein [Aestuariivirga litoralis]|uniref:Gfo/Idh/MocA family protein n=1 Tax=Aestuariivirga litoralis TaxID=2650924 RepID=UPI0018C63D98|nr:Gfo/Idh/MocA family oxidoreductase [Aestuariivirga litoralis]MBG1233492.1 Gfo/Idh/MocA family oxidoreductase [Aestuariivirga litoralis]
MRIGVVGYGSGGRYFHAPFIAAARNCELSGIVARAPETIAAAKADWPNVPIFRSLAAMISAGVCDAVTVTTPPQTRRELVLEAIAAGLHVVADKPFAPDATGAIELDAAAKAKGVVLGVYHNRRYDADMQTLSQLVEAGRLGKIWSVYSRMDLDEPGSLDPGPTGGLLRDLGSHVVDQMLFLLGPVASVDAQMDFIDLPAGLTDASFNITLRHESGAHSHVSASKVNHIAAREFRAYGALGSYVSSTTDVQVQSILAGKRPIDNLAYWGFEPEANWGTLHTYAGAAQIPSAQGRYHDYYESFELAVRTGSPPPVTAEAGSRVLAVLDAARKSAKEGNSVEL